MKMNTFDKPVIRDAKEPVIMLCAHLSNDEKPDLLHIVGGEVWVTDWDSFFDAGFDDQCQFLPVSGDMTKPQTEARSAWEYFYNGADSGEYGEPFSAAENENRKRHMAALFELVTGNKLIFKEVA